MNGEAWEPTAARAGALHGRGADGRQAGKGRLVGALSRAVLRIHSASDVSPKPLGLLFSSGAGPRQQAAAAAPSNAI